METIQRQRMETEALKEELEFKSLLHNNLSILWESKFVNFKNTHFQNTEMRMNTRKFQLQDSRKPDSHHLSYPTFTITTRKKKSTSPIAISKIKSIAAIFWEHRPRGFQLPAQAPIQVPAPAFTEPNRRQTIMQRLDRLNTTPDTNIRVYKNTPSYDYLALTKLDIEHVIQFISGIDLYQSKHNLSVPAAVLIPNGIRDRLLTYSTFNGQPPQPSELPCSE